MDWKNFWDKHASSNNVLEQVGRNGITAKQMEILMKEQASRAVALLELTSDAKLLDVCCGNGAFSMCMFPFVKSLVGIDLSSLQIEQANRNKQINTRFETVDVLNLTQWEKYSSLLQTFDGITLCFSFQYFETFEKGAKVIHDLLPLLKSGGKILLTDVPDRARFFNHYTNFSRLFGLFVQMLKDKNVMGKFWSSDEMKIICNNEQVQGEFLIQPKHYAYAHYRFDYLITKP